MIRFLFYFVVSFFILSFPIGKQKMFYYIDTVTAPILGPAYKTVSTVSKEKFYDIKIWAMGFIGNSQDTKYKTGSIDKITTKLSAPTRVDQDVELAKKVKEMTEEDFERKSEIQEVEYYSDEEVKQLEAMLRQSN